MHWYAGLVGGRAIRMVRRFQSGWKRQREGARVADDWEGALAVAGPHPPCVPSTSAAIVAGGTAPGIRAVHEAPTPWCEPGGQASEPWIIHCTYHIIERGDASAPGMDGAVTAIYRVEEALK